MPVDVEQDILTSVLALLLVLRQIGYLSGSNAKTSCHVSSSIATATINMKLTVAKYEEKQVSSDIVLASNSTVTILLYSGYISAEQMITKRGVTCIVLTEKLGACFI